MECALANQRIVGQLSSKTLYLATNCSVLLPKYNVKVSLLQSYSTFLGSFTFYTFLPTVLLFCVLFLCLREVLIYEISYRWN